MIGFSLVFFFKCSEDSPDIAVDTTLIKSFIVNGVSGEIDDENRKIEIGVPVGTNVASLTPAISLGTNVSISPESGVTQDFSSPLNYTVTSSDKSTIVYSVAVEVVTCVDASNVVEFNSGGKKYEIVKEGKSWKDAAKCAVERGGYLAEINSASEQASIYSKLQNASLNLGATFASDGGDASYVWIGGNDLSKEGTWVWDGDNTSSKTEFWIGNWEGSAVNGAYTNWGGEPDDSSGQDALGIGLTDWPFGVAGQWNDLRDSNKLFFVIEFD